MVENIFLDKAMVIVRITDLALKTIVGTNKWERVTKQRVIINAEFEYDSSAAIKTDNIYHTVDYKTITKKIIVRVRNSRFFLLEKLTDCVLRIIMEDKKVKRAYVRVDKPLALRFAKSVSVELSAKR